MKRQTDQAVKCGNWQVNMPFYMKLKLYFMRLLLLITIIIHGLNARTQVKNEYYYNSQLKTDLVTNNNGPKNLGIDGQWYRSSSRQMPYKVNSQESLLSYTQFKNKPGTFLLTDFNLYLIKSKINNISFENCSEQIIESFIKEFGDKMRNADMQNYPHSNEFQQKRIIQSVRDSLFKYSKMYTLDDIYVFTSLRLLGQYQFDNGYYPILGRVADPLFPAAQQGIIEGEVYHKIPYDNVYLSNGNSFPLNVKLKPDSAEKILVLKSKFKTRQELLMDTRTIYSDGLGNNLNGEDRRIFLEYFISFENLNAGTESKEKSPNTIRAKILRVDFYIDKDFKKKVFTEVDQPTDFANVNKNITKDNSSDQVSSNVQLSKLKDDIYDTTVYTKVDSEAEYPGGAAAWLRYVNMHLRYPDDAVNNEIQGTVIVQFIVDKEGNVSDVEAISGPDNGGLREEAMSVIQKSGKWTPAIQNGRRVKSYKRRPMVFKLQSQ